MIEVCTIALSRGQIALIDGEDADRVSAYSWYATRARQKAVRWYAASGKTSTHPFMLLHRLIMNAGEEDLVDHVNGDSLDCRKANLRIANPGQNAWNRRNYSEIKYRGVYEYAGKRVTSYRARIAPKGLPTMNLGTFSSAIAAAKAYDAAALKFYGDWAGLNFPGGVN